MIHCAIAGSLERAIALLIEHFAGVFPLWLAPVQVMVVPVSEKYNAYGRQVLDSLREAGLRARIDDDNDSLGKRIRAAELQKIPYILVVGEKEAKTGQVAARRFGQGDQGVEELADFIDKAKAQVALRSL